MIIDLAKEIRDILITRKRTRPNSRPSISARCARVYIKIGPYATNSIPLHGPSSPLFTTLSPLFYYPFTTLSPPYTYKLTTIPYIFHATVTTHCPPVAHPFPTHCLPIPHLLHIYPTISLPPVSWPITIRS